MRKMRSVLVGMFATAMIVTAGCGKGSGPTAAEGEVVVATEDLDVHFVPVEPFAETFIVFGGLHTTQRNAIGDVALSALSMEDARPIYAKYPDFHRCASPGAARAKKAVRQMNLVATDSDVLEVLEEVLADHARSLRGSGDRVCVRLTGAKLKMTAAVVRQAKENIKRKLPRQAIKDYYLVESAEIVEALKALKGG